jgi:hypothetical protein
MHTYSSPASPAYPQTRIEFYTYITAKLFLCLSNYCTMKTYPLIKDHAMKTVGVEVQLPAFLTSTLDGDEWSAPSPDRITHGKESPVLTGQLDT